MAKNVEDLMTRNPRTVRTDETLVTALNVMTEALVRHLPVVNPQGDLVGIVSHRDLVRSALFVLEELPIGGQGPFLEKMLVSEVMTSDPATVLGGDSAVEAAQSLLENKFSCLLVVDGNTLVGILTESDFVKHFVAQELAEA